MEGRGDNGCFRGAEEEPGVVETMLPASLSSYQQPHQAGPGHSPPTAEGAEAALPFQRQQQVRSPAGLASGRLFLTCRIESALSCFCK